MYPSHRLFIQVALSQLVNVDGDHPEWAATRNRIDKLVADFVLCLTDLSVVAVIELDDWSHKRADRQNADARKTKALTDAGLRLIRIPDGPLPSTDALRDMIDGHPSSDYLKPLSAQSASTVPHLRLADEEPINQSETLVADHEWRAHKAVYTKVLRTLLAGALLAGGWYVYVHVMPLVVQAAFKDLAAPPLSKPSPAIIIASTPDAPQSARSAVAITLGPSKEELETKRAADVQAAEATRKQKQLAWAAFFNPAASCDHPNEWKAQVECGNQYMRAKKAFEVEWSKSHGGGSDDSEVVLDNHSFNRPGR